MALSIPEELDGIIDNNEINELIDIDNKFLLGYIKKNKINNNLQKSISSSNDMKNINKLNKRSRKIYLKTV